MYIPLPCLHLSWRTVAQIEAELKRFLLILSAINEAQIKYILSPAKVSPLESSLTLGPFVHLIVHQSTEIQAVRGGERNVMCNAVSLY